jgi:hypothetical protein
MAAGEQQLQDGDNETADKSPVSPQQQRNDSPARSSSPNGTAASTQAVGGQHQQQLSTTSHPDRGSRRDRISVGSRMTRTVIVRPRRVSIPSISSRTQRN